MPEQIVADANVPPDGVKLETDEAHEHVVLSPATQPRLQKPETHQVYDHVVRSVTVLHDKITLVPEWVQAPAMVSTALLPRLQRRETARCKILSWSPSYCSTVQG